MRYLSALAALAIISLALTAQLAAQDAATAAWRRFSARASQTLLEAQRMPAAVPPLPAGVAALGFNEFFHPVVGDRGLDLSVRLKSLDGKRVRIAGFMTRDVVRHRGLFLLTAWPTKIENDGFCLSDDLPPALLHVLLPNGAEREPVAYVPGPLLLTGILEVGLQLTADGRNSYVRLRLDAPLSAPVAANPAQ